MTSGDSVCWALRAAAMGGWKFRSAACTSTGEPTRGFQIFTGREAALESRDKSRCMTDKRDRFPLGPTRSGRGWECSLCCTRPFGEPTRGGSPDSCVRRPRCRSWSTVRRDATMGGYVSAQRAMAFDGPTNSRHELADARFTLRVFENEANACACSSSPRCSGRIGVSGGAAPRRRGRRRGRPPVKARQGLMTGGALLHPDPRAATMGVRV